jgi:HSP20 family protein
VSLQKPDHYEVTADLPGFKKEEINVEIQNGTLRISAEHSDKKDDEGERDGWKYHRMERSSGSMFRTVKLPPAADLDHVNATSLNGLLSITVPKKADSASSSSKRVSVS